MPSPVPDLDAYERAPRRVRLGVGAVLVLLLLALGATVLGGMLRGADGGTIVEAVEAGDDRILVHVSGAVRAPGIYQLDVQARVVDAVAAAGGFTEDADDAGVNLARAVVDGEQLIVPPQAAEGAAAPISDGLVHLNTADAPALEELPRIGPALAQRILDWRETNGPFTAVDQLRNVAGIGDKMLATLRPLVAL